MKKIAILIFFVITYYNGFGQFSIGGSIINLKTIRNTDKISTTLPGSLNFGYDFAKKTISIKLMVLSENNTINNQFISNQLFFVFIHRLENKIIFFNSGYIYSPTIFTKISNKNIKYLTHGLGIYYSLGSEFDWFNVEIGSFLCFDFLGIYKVPKQGFFISYQIFLNKYFKKKQIFQNRFEQ